MMVSNIITQLSIFVNNEPGRLAAIATVFTECNINIKAFSLAESTEFGILRAIVDEPDKAFDCLKSKGIIVKKTDVIGVTIGVTPGSLIQAVNVLSREGINIEYGYAYTGKSSAAFFIRVDDPAKAIDVLTQEGVCLIKDEEI